MCPAAKGSGCADLAVVRQQTQPNDALDDAKHEGEASYGRVLQHEAADVQSTALADSRTPNDEGEAVDKGVL
jgi:hypothetical protein